MGSNFLISDSPSHVMEQLTAVTLESSEEEIKSEGGRP